MKMLVLGVTLLQQIQIVQIVWRSYPEKHMNFDSCTQDKSKHAYFP